MLKTRIITAVILLVLLLALLYLNSYPAVVIACGVFFGAAAWEEQRLFGSKQALVGAALWTAAFLYLAFARTPPDAVVLFGVCVAIWAVRLTPSLGLGLPPLTTSFANRLLGGIYGIAIMGCFFAILALYRHSGLYLFSVMALVWIADIGAYFSGKAFGKRKLAPSISPGKSWEGAIGGWIAVLLAAGSSAMVPQLADTFAAHVLARFGWAIFALVMTLMVAASVVGDLFESQLKRRAGFKDSSNLLPGHGGVLDRIDALIPALPLAVLVDVWL
jgi:phosphatidate cytidylyltransferase